MMKIVDTKAFHDVMHHADALDTLERSIGTHPHRNADAYQRVRAELLQGANAAMLEALAELAQGRAEESEKAEKAEKASDADRAYEEQMARVDARIASNAG